MINHTYNNNWLNHKFLTLTSKERTDNLVNTEAPITSSMREGMLLAQKQFALLCLSFALILICLFSLTYVPLFFIQWAFSVHSQMSSPLLKGENLVRQDIMDIMVEWRRHISKEVTANVIKIWINDWTAFDSAFNPFDFQDFQNGKQLKSFVEDN